MPKYHGYDLKTVKDFSALERVLRYSSEFHEMRLDWKRKRKKSEEEEEDEEKPRWEEGKEREWGGRGGKEGILFEAKSSSQSRGHPCTNLWEGEEQYDALKDDFDLGTMTTVIWQGDNGVKGNDGDTMMICDNNIGIVICVATPH